MSKERWIEQQRADRWQILAVELPDGAIALPRLEAARQRTVVLLGHEWHGVPEEQVTGADACVEIPMVGSGASLNVGRREPGALPAGRNGVMPGASTRCGRRWWHPNRIRTYARGQSWENPDRGKGQTHAEATEPPTARRRH